MNANTDHHNLQNRHLPWQAAAAMALWILLSVAAWAAPEKDFTVVTLPDTQYYSEKYPKIWAAQIDWIVANRKNLNIVYVVHLGDITQNGDGKPEEWAIASDALYRLENPTTTGRQDGIPYGVVPGNHDHMGGTREFNKFFGVDHFAKRPYYGGHHGTDNNSHFDKFTASGLEFIVLYIDFDNDKRDYAPVDAWADEVLKANAKRRAIVVSHDLLAANGSFDPRGKAIYDNLKGNPNLFLMLCGHHHGEAYRYDSHEGLGVMTCLSDYQGAPEGGGGYLRLYRFSPSENLVHVLTYSPWLKEYKTDPANQFAFCYLMDGGSLRGLGVPRK